MHWSTTLSELFVIPTNGSVNAAGLPYAAAKLYFYKAGTLDDQAVYTDSACTVAHPQPVQADTSGKFPLIYKNPNALADYRYILRTALGVLIEDKDNIPKSPITQADVVAVLDLDSIIQTSVAFARTLAEISAGVTPTEYSRLPAPIDVGRYGIVPNDLSAATSNSDKLIALLDPTKTGPIGRLIFPPLNGADTYHFNKMIQVRDGIRMDLMGCTLSFAKTYAGSDDLMGFFTFIRDVSIENGSITVDYDGTGGTNAGLIFRIGSRLGYKFGSFTTGIEEEDLTVPMGNIVLRNLRLSTNNPAVVANALIGGLRNVCIENIVFDGGGEAPHAFYYEFGDWHYEATVANRKTTHASGLYFNNIDISNLDTAATDGAGIGIVGAASAYLNNIRVDTAKNGLQFRPGEALYYNPGTPDVGMVKRCITVRDFQAKNISGTGLALVGTESKAGGYLSGEPLTESQQTDLMRFSIDGVLVSAAGAGITVNGPCDIRNGTLNGVASSGQLIIGDECIRGVFTNMEMRNSSSNGVRANMGDALWATPRLKTLVFTNCQVTANTGAGYIFGRTKSVEIHSGRIGNQLVVDGVAETTQTVGVSVDQTTQGGGVYCYGVDVATSSGSAYSLNGTITNPCGVFHPKGTVTFTGNWDIDGVARTDDSNFTAKASYLNTAGKYAGRKAFNTTDNKEYFARGATDVSVWGVADASATITPA